MWTLARKGYMKYTWSHKGYMKCELMRGRGIWNTLDRTRGIWNVNSCVEGVYEIHLIAQGVYEMWTHAQKGYMEHTWLHNIYMDFLCIADEEYEYMHGSKQPIRSGDCSTVQDKSYYMRESVTWVGLAWQISCYAIPEYNKVFISWCQKVKFWKLVFLNWRGDL